MTRPLSKRAAAKLAAAAAEAAEKAAPRTRAQIAAEVFLRHHDAGVPMGQLARIYGVTVGDILDMLAEHTPIRRAAELHAATRAGESETPAHTSACQSSDARTRMARALELLGRGMELHAVAERTGLSPSEIRAELSK